jgi:hypothetical protein
VLVECIDARSNPFSNAHKVTAGAVARVNRAREEKSWSRLHWLCCQLLHAMHSAETDMFLSPFPLEARSQVEVFRARDVNCVTIILKAV